MDPESSETFSNLWGPKICFIDDYLDPKTPAGCSKEIVTVRGGSHEPAGAKPSTSRVFNLWTNTPIKPRVRFADEAGGSDKIGTTGISGGKATDFNEGEANTVTIPYKLRRRDRNNNICYL